MNKSQTRTREFFDLKNVYSVRTCLWLRVHITLLSKTCLIRDQLREMVRIPSHVLFVDLDLIISTTRIQKRAILEAKFYNISKHNLYSKFHCLRKNFFFLLIIYTKWSDYLKFFTCFLFHVMQGID